MAPSNEDFVGSRFRNTDSAMSAFSIATNQPIASPSLTNQVSDRLNIIVITVDDMGYAGRNRHNTPTYKAYNAPGMDRLAAEGMCSTDCSPTRAGLQRKPPGDTQ
jgi:hypothetical protein